MFITGTREAAYMHAITAAGLSHIFSKGCSLGKFKRCGCDESKVGSEKTFTWGGCSQDIVTGNAYSKRFTDAEERLNVTKYSLMDQHNHQVGRKVSRALQKELS